MPWNRKWQPTPVFLPGKYHGQRSLSMGPQRVGHDWVSTHRLANARLPQTFNLFKKKKNAVSAKCNNVKLSKMRYACIMVFDYTIEDNLHRNSIRGNIPNQRTMLKHWSLQNFLYFFIFSFLPGCTLVGSWFPDQGLNLAPHLWKSWFLTTGLPGNSLVFYFLHHSMLTLISGIIVEKVSIVWYM